MTTIGNGETLVKTAAGRQLVRCGTLRRLREAAGISQTELGAAVGVDQSAISKFECGHRLPRGPVAARIAEVLLEIGPLVSIGDDLTRKAVAA